MEAQKLNFEYQDGFYKITLKHSGKSLTVKDNNLIDDKTYDDLLEIGMRTFEKN